MIIIKRFQKTFTSLVKDAIKMIDIKNKLTNENARNKYNQLNNLRILILLI